MAYGRSMFPRPAPRTGGYFGPSFPGWVAFPNWTVSGCPRLIIVAGTLRRGQPLHAIYGPNDGVPHSGSNYVSAYRSRSPSLSKGILRMKRPNKEGVVSAEAAEGRTSPEGVRSVRSSDQGPCVLAPKESCHSRRLVPIDFIDLFITQPVGY
jgi:hypothetical protein